MVLADIAICSAKPGDKPIKLFDGSGLFLHILPAGYCYWRTFKRLTAERWHEGPVHGGSADIVEAVSKRSRR